MFILQRLISRSSRSLARSIGWGSAGSGKGGRCRVRGPGPAVVAKCRACVSPPSARHLSPVTLRAMFYSNRPDFLVPSVFAFYGRRLGTGVTRFRVLPALG
jgi:hypothetical protein